MVAAVSNMDAIRTQVEYYFSDSNLPKDRFLRAKTEENEHGYVPLNVIASFKRLRSLNASAQLIAQAVQSSELVGVDEKRENIRRIIPLPEKSEFLNRGLFVKGWIPNTKEPTIEEIKALFEPSGNVLSVRVRRWNDSNGERHFKGSMFVEMESGEAASRVAADDFTIQVTDDDGALADKKLLILPVDEYFAMKKEKSRRFSKKMGGKRKRDQKDDEEGEKARDEGTADDGVVPGAAEAENVMEGSTSVPGAAPSTKKRRTSTANDAEIKGDVGQSKTNGHAKSKDENHEIVPGIVLKFENFGPEVSREDIREAFEDHGDISWVDFSRGNSEGYIRFATAEMAKTAMNAMTSEKIEFGGQLPKYNILEGEEEEAYWKHIWKKKEENAERMKQRRRERGGFRGRRKRGGFRSSGRGRRADR